MAFYPDELSPIDHIRSLGKQADSLPDIGPLKNRRQWKSLVLGKKDMGMNNFATIAEEKEEEISSDGSQGASSGKGNSPGFPANPVAVTNKKITFPKPRKYITSRVSERKDDERRGIGNPGSYASLGTPVKESFAAENEAKRTESAKISNASKPPLEAKPPAKADKSKDFAPLLQDFVQNYALAETPIEAQWNEVFSEGPGFASWAKANPEKAKHDPAQGPKPKKEEKRKSSGSSKSSVEKRSAKESKKKASSARKKSNKANDESPSNSNLEKTPTGKTKPKSEKGKALNMKEVVNVYKNLAYGSKEEIKSFVENLSFVKDESKAENDKNLLSMMNLKALENKIKNFAKKSGKTQEAPPPQEKKPKPEKPIKKNRKAHIERLARHKVPKTASAQKETNRSASAAEVKEPKNKKAPAKDKEPWKFVGMESALDKTYFVYPAYPPSVNLKNTPKARKTSANGKAKAAKQTAKPRKGIADAPKSSESKVKPPQVVVKPKPFVGGGPNVSGSASNKSMNRPSAMTVCTVKFRPAVGQKPEEPPVGADQSLLVYLHGTKAIHVKSPYSDKQFSRVKFFRKDERGVPLIKGLGRRCHPKGGGQTVSVRNISLPGKLNRVRSLDLLDFDEDIENITDFLRSQESPERQRQEDRQGVKKSEREWWPRELPKDQDAATSRHQRRQRRATHDLHPLHHHLHRGASPDNFSPDSIINEISKNIQHLQYLPDTEANRKMIAGFFDELDQRIEASRNGALTFQKFPSPPCSDSFGPIPILGY